MSNLRENVENFLDKSEKEGLHDYQKRNIDAIQRSIDSGKLESGDAFKKIILELRKENIWLKSSEERELQKELEL
ncbi:MAG: hypothetical protein OEV93_01480 [Candidatus Moranbacteria bacterium]|nr:hypothetical protein [Candidatus Moranbacteria bacterium]